MTRRPAPSCYPPDVTDADLRRECERLLGRYVVEVVERFGFCPWSRRARERGEIRVEVVTGATVDFDEVTGAVRAIAAAAPVGMVVFPRARPSPAELRRLRDHLVAQQITPPVGIADFHPDAGKDLSSPARAVAFLRRSPDPMLQVVRLDVLATARAAAPAPSLAGQAAILAGHAPPPALPVPDQIAAVNLATALANLDALTEAIAAIHADRDAAYRSLSARR